MNAFDRLVTIMETLRGPGGCPWDAEQDHQSLINGLIEEVYELAEAVDKDDPERMAEELGDVLLHVVFHAVIARGKKEFDIETVILRLCDKLIYRHPHVFGETVVNDSAEVIQNWARLKKTENEKSKRDSIFSGIPKNLPALLYAKKIQSAAGRVNFDWPDAAGVMDKIKEEMAELAEVMGRDKARMEEEIGDLLFSVINLARKLNVDPEAALRRVNRKFVQRFLNIEKAARKRRIPLAEMPMEEKDKIWESSK